MLTGGRSPLPSTGAGVPFLRRERAHGKRVNRRPHRVAEGGEYGALACEMALTAERGRDDDDAEVAAAARCSGMAGVSGAFVFDPQVHGGERVAQRRFEPVRAR